MARLPRSPMHRQAILNRSMIAGGAGGRTAIVSPEPRPLAAPGSGLVEKIPITNAGPMTAGRSTPWFSVHPITIGMIVVTARNVATEDSTFRLRVAGTLTGPVVTLAAGDDYELSEIGVTIPATTQWDLECLTAGAGLGDVGGYIEISA